MRALRLSSLLMCAALVLAAAAFSASSPSQYRAQVAAVCAQVKAATKAQPVLMNPTRAQYQKFILKTFAITTQEYVSLKALRPPSSLAALHADAIRSLAKVVAAESKAAKQMQAGVDPDQALKSAAPTMLSAGFQILADFGRAGVTGCS